MRDQVATTTDALERAAVPSAAPAVPAASPARGLTPQGVLALQRTAGNRAVASRMPMQRKATGTAKAQALKRLKAEFGISSVREGTVADQAQRVAGVPQFLSADIQYPFCQNSKNKIQFCFSSWYQDYPAASDFLDILLGCGSFHPNSNASPNIAQFCNKSIQAKMDAAGQQGITDPSGANEKWAQVDKEVTDQAPWVAMFNPKYVNFVSKRVKGFIFSPQWYFLIDQASVK